MSKTITFQKEYPEYFIHTKNRDSILSNNQIDALVNFRGLLNCMGLFLIISNLNLIIHNFEKYGVLIVKLARDFSSSPNSGSDYIFNSIGYTCVFILSLYIIINLGLSGRFKIGSNLWNLINIFGFGFFFSIGTFYIFISKANFFISFGCQFYLIIVFMKLFSLQFYIYKSRKKAKRKKLTFKYYLYFLIVPTIIFQENYPRTKSIRIYYCLKKVFEVCFCTIIVIFIMTQYVMPYIFLHNESENALNLVTSGLFRIIKFSFPVVCAWLIAFYGFFHSYLNLLAELTYFGDRLFYKDWWNCDDFGEYWKKWNLPVHQWGKVHIFFPLLDKGFSINTSGLAVFLISAIGHELIMIVSMHNFTFPYCFVALLLQVPLIRLTIYLRGLIKEPWPNLIFWILFCVFGTPIAMLSYGRSFMLINPTLFDKNGNILYLK